MSDALSAFDERALVGLRVRTIRFEWEAGRLELWLHQEGANEEAPPDTLLYAEGVTLLRCPRQQRWTESARIYELRRKGAGARHRLEVELQSGDVLEIEADSVGARRASEASVRR